VERPVHSKEWTGPAKEWTVPAKEWTVPAKERIVPAKEWTVPAKERIVPAKEWTVPAKERIVPAKEWTVPAKERIVHSKERIVPAKERIVDSRAWSGRDARALAPRAQVTSVARHAAPQTTPAGRGGCGEPQEQEMPDYIPATDAGFDAWQNQFLTYLNANLAALGLAPPPSSLPSLPKE
jgi:hypothetical protein